MKTKPLTMERLFQLADENKSVYWVHLGKKRPAAFMQNWNARQLHRMIKDGGLVEVVNEPA